MPSNVVPESTGGGFGRPQSIVIGSRQGGAIPTGVALELRQVLWTVRVPLGKGCRKFGGIGASPRLFRRHLILEGFQRNLPTNHVALPFEQFLGNAGRFLSGLVELVGLLLELLREIVVATLNGEASGHIVGHQLGLVGLHLTLDTILFGT